MADLKNSQFYQNMGGVNLKVSEYQLNKTEFLNLRNVDFDVPNSLQKRPGSTQAVSVGTSSAIIGLFEYVKLNGSSWIVAGSNSALFYIQSAAYTVLNTGWNNGQPQDMLTFVNRLWIADGGRYKWWDGGETFANPIPAGLPMQVTPLDLAIQWQGGISPLTFASDFSYATSSGVTQFFVAGATATIRGSSYITRGVYLAYSYVRSDGYIGPADFLSNARNIIRGTPTTDGDEYFSQTHIPSQPGWMILTGFSLPTDLGITAVQLWLATDTVSASSSSEFLEQVNLTTNNVGASLVSQSVPVGNLGWRVRTSNALNFMSVTLKPTADLSLFRLFTQIPINGLFTVTNSDYSGLSLPSIGITFAPTNFSGALSFTTWSGGVENVGFSGMTFDFWSTYIPKYIDVNQNVMFMAGFSSAPSTVWFSDVGQPEVIQPESNFEVRTNDGDRIIGIRAYNNNMIVFKTTSFQKIIGTTADDFQVVELSLEFGAISNNAIIEYNEKLLFLDRKGIVQYDGASWKIISDDIDDIFRSMNLSAAYEKATAVHAHYRNQVWFAIPYGESTQNNLTIVWDYLIDAWTFFDGFNASAFAVAKSTLSKPTVWRGSNSGMVYYFGDSFYGDNGVGITCLTLSHFDKFLGENYTSVWRRLFLDVSPVTGLTGVISGKVFKDYDKSTVRATFTMYQSQFQSKAEMGVVGKAMSFEVTHNSASLPFLLNGYTWAKRNLRDV